MEKIPSLRCIFIQLESAFSIRSSLTGYKKRGRFVSQSLNQATTDLPEERGGRYIPNGNRTNHPPHTNQTAHWLDGLNIDLQENPFFFCSNCLLFNCEKNVAFTLCVLHGAMRV